jgi:hypothetical protein
MSRFLLIIVFISIAIVVAGINRGFDFSDEGLYVLLADPNQANIGGVINFDLFFKLLHQLFGVEFGIVGLRIIRLFSYFAGAWALAVFWRNANSEKSISSEIYLLAVLGLFGGYGFLPSSLSYNSISVVLACFWLASISKKEKQWIDFFSLGTILGLLFYVKITSCLILGCLTLSISFYKGEFNWKQIPSLVLPFILMELAFFIFLNEAGVSRILTGLDLMSSRKDYGYVLLFKYLAVGFFWLFLVFVPFGISGYFSQRSKLKSYGFGFLGAGILILVFIKTFITDEWNHGVQLFTIGVVGFLLGRNKVRNLSSIDHLNLILLIGMPFFLFLGSNVYWLRLGIHYWVFWIFALLFLVSGFSVKVQNGLKITIAFISLIVLTNGIWVNPFGQEPLWNADHPWEYGTGKKILITHQQLDLLKELKVKTDQYRSDQVMAIYRIPGMLYLLDKNSPKSPGYWNKSHLNSYFPEGFNSDLIIYSPSDSLPAGDWKAYKKQRLGISNSEEIQVLWR